MHCHILPLDHCTLPPLGWYFMLSVDPIFEDTFFRSGRGVLGIRGMRGARGTGGFFGRGTCFGTGGLVMREGRGAGVPSVAGVAEVLAAFAGDFFNEGLTLARMNKMGQKKKSR